MDNIHKETVVLPIWSTPQWKLWHRLNINNTKEKWIDATTEYIISIFVEAIHLGFYAWNSKTRNCEVSKRRFIDLYLSEMW